MQDIQSHEFLVSCGSLTFSIQGIPLWGTCASDLSSIMFHFSALSSSRSSYINQQEAQSSWFIECPQQMCEKKLHFELLTFISWYFLAKEQYLVAPLHSHHYQAIVEIDRGRTIVIKVHDILGYNNSKKSIFSHTQIRVE